MINYLLHEFNEYFYFFNIFDHIYSRILFTILTSISLVFLFSPILIKKLKIQQRNGQPIRNYGPKNHLFTKKGTPTMGGIIIISSIIINTLLWGNLSNKYIWCILFIIIGFSLIGYYDDYLKIKHHLSDTKFTRKIRLLFEFLIAIIAIIAIGLIQSDNFNTLLIFPIFKNLSFDLKYFFPIFAVFTIVSFANAVNLTDGLDGLAIGLVIIISIIFCLISYIVGNSIFSKYLQIYYVEGADELSIVLAALIGSGIGFLWFNTYPAMIFMGDTSSLALGALLGMVAVIVKHEIFLCIVGGVFVVETMSVIIQVIFFKITGRRIFKMTPLHHHFEEKGCLESTIVIRFWIISIFLAIIGLLIFKLN